MEVSWQRPRVAITTAGLYQSDNSVRVSCWTIDCKALNKPDLADKNVWKSRRSESMRKKYGMGFWRHELGVIVVALKNRLKRSGLGYGKLPWPIGGRQIADSMTTKALELDGERRFLLRFDELCVALPNAARYRETASKGCNGWRVDSDWRPLASILSLLGLRRHD